MRRRHVGLAALFALVIVGAFAFWFVGAREGELAAAEQRPTASASEPTAASDHALDAGSSLTAAANADDVKRDSAAPAPRRAVTDESSASYLVGTVRTTLGEPLAAGAVEIVVSQFFPEPDEAPLAAALSSRRRVEMSHMRTAVIRDGRYRVGPIWPGPCRLYVHGDRVDAQHSEFDVPAAPGEIVRDLVLVQQRVVSVRVRTPQREPFARALIFAEDLLPPFPLSIVATREPLPHRAIEPDSDFDFGWLEPHDLLSERIRVVAAQNGAVREPHDAVSLAAEPVGHFALDLRRVRDGDDFIGELIVPELPLHANVLWRGQPIRSQPLAADATELTLELERKDVRSALSSLRVFVVDAADRRPITDARVVVGRIGATVATAVTSADGSCTVFDLPASRVLVGVSAGGHASVSRWCELPVAGRAELGELALVAAVNVTIRTRTPRGEFERHAIEVGELGQGGVEPGLEPAATEIASAWPAGRCVVRSEQMSLARATPQAVYTAEAEAALAQAREVPLGRATRVEPAREAPASRAAESGGRTFLVDEHTRYERLCLPPVIVDFTTAVDGEIVLDLVPGSACDLVLGLPRSPAVLVRVSTRAGLPVLEQTRSGDATVRAVLAPGDYSVRVTDGARLVAEQAFTVAHEREVVPLR